MAWQAACQAAHTAAELALQLRALDECLQWDAMRPPAASDPLSHAELLDKRPAADGNGWEYSVSIPATFQAQSLIHRACHSDV